jgi:hypothetical protein
VPTSGEPINPVADEAIERLAESAQRLAEAKSKLMPMKERYKHRLKIDISTFDEARAQLAEAAAQIQELPSVVNQAQTEVLKAKNQMKDGLRRVAQKSAALPLKADGFDPETLFEPDAEDRWRTAALKFITLGRENLMASAEIGMPFTHMAWKIGPSTWPGLDFILNPGLMTDPNGDWNRGSTKTANRKNWFCRPAWSSLIFFKASPTGLSFDPAI